MHPSLSAPCISFTYQWMLRERPSRKLLLAAASAQRAPRPDSAIKKEFCSPPSHCQIGDKSFRDEASTSGHGNYRPELFHEHTASSAGVSWGHFRNFSARNSLHRQIQPQRSPKAVKSGYLQGSITTDLAALGDRKRGSLSLKPQAIWVDLM